MIRVAERIAMIKKEVAVIVEAPVQFFSIKNTIDRLLRDGKKVDIVVPYLENYKVVSNAAYSVLKKYGYKYIGADDLKNRQYKVCLAPYPVVGFGVIDAKYRIRYGYSILTAKPNPTYNPGHKVWFDAIICHGPQEAEIMKAYADTYNISPMKYDGFAKEKKRSKGKPVLLYLPTSGDVSSADQAEEIVTTLKEDYRVIVRMHAHIAHKQNSEEAARYELIKKIADEVCDDTTPLVDWLRTADVVLSDNSGSIYEALYSQTPVAVFAKNVKARTFGFTVPLHARLIDEGVIPYSNKIKDLKKLLQRAMSPEIRKKQQAARKKYFNTDGNGVGELMKIIDNCLKDNVNQEKWWLHRRLADEFYAFRQAHYEYEGLLHEKNELERQVTYYRNAKGYKLMAKLYGVYHRLRGRK